MLDQHLQSVHFLDLSIDFSPDMETISFSEAVSILWSNPASEREAAVNYLLKILCNISQNPDNPKFRSLKLSWLQKHLDSVLGAVDLLRIVGFREVEQDFILPADLSASAAQEALACLQFRNEESHRQYDQQVRKIAEEANARMQAELEEKKKKREALKARIDCARKEKKDDMAMHPTQSSVANKLDFGSKGNVVVRCQNAGG